MSKKHDKCEICQNDAQKQFQEMDHLETRVNDTRTPPAAEVMHRTVWGDAGMTHLMHQVMHSMVGHCKNLGNPLTGRSACVDPL